MGEKTDLERVKAARDLVAVSEFERTESGKRLVATTYSSKALGLSIREEIKAEAEKEIKPRRAQREDQA
jgi:hypothetical protein